MRKVYLVVRVLVLELIAVTARDTPEVGRVYGPCLEAVRIGMEAGGGRAAALGMLELCCDP